MLATALMTFSACSDDDSSSSTPAAGGGSGGGGSNISAESMSVKIDGLSKTFEDVFGVEVFGTISLIGSDNSSSGYPQLTISLNDTLPTGTYSFPGSGLPSMTFTNDSTSTYITSSGSISILTNDAANDRVTGTFNVGMTNASNPSNTINLTEGQFNISY